MKKDFDTIFPIGYHNFHKNQAYNYQLNRWYSLGFMNYEDIKNISKNIKTFKDWKTEMVTLAVKAESDQNLLSAAFFYRAAEFYTLDGDHPDKEYFYDKFSELFYKTVDANVIERRFITYTDDKKIPAIKIAAKGKRKGTILINGGFDSFIEEFYYIMEYLSSNAFDVIGFEGPGQGHMLLKQGVPLDYKWEKPVKFVLDYYGLNDVTLFGLSMGGWFCLRAAAHEPRIKNVIASGHAVDYSEIPPAFARWLMLFFIKNFRSYTGKSFEKIVKKGGIKGWQVSNLAHITQMEPLEAFEFSLNLNEENLCCDKIRQNVLYLTARDDHFIPYKIHAKQLKLFTNVKSLKDRVYYKHEYANNHCQVGNIKLMLDDIIEGVQ